MSHAILNEILILLLGAVIGVSLFRRFRLPPILAYLAVGCVVGPYGLGWIPNTQDTRFLAEFGVVFLLFTVGLEFSLPQLLAMRREVLGLGGAQVLITTVFGALAAWLAGMPPEASVVIGGILAMSSTAIVIKQLTEQLEVGSRHGRNSVGVLLFQDVAVLPFLLIIPVLAGDSETGVLHELIWVLLKGAALVAVMLSAGYWLLRPLFHEIASSRSAELFTLTALLFALTAAWGSERAGLSMPLGAFLAGMLLGETEFRHQVEVDIRPFRDVLLGLFFVTVGMELNIRALPEIGLWVVLLLVVIVSFKTVSITALGVAMGAQRPVALRTGLVLAQGGEFGFALLSVALSAGVLDWDSTQVVLAALILSMVLTPFLVRYNGAIARRVFAGSYRRNQQQPIDEVANNARYLNQHVIVCGYGRVGQSIGRFAEQEGFEYIALDLDPVRVRDARTAGESVNYGDATHREILEAAGLQRAKVLVISFDDVVSALKITSQVRAMRLSLPILVRTRDDADLERLQKAGATEVVPETLEASLMLVSHLLLLLGIPISRILRHMQQVRGNRYALLRAFFRGQDPVSVAESPAFRERLHTVTLPDGAFAVGRQLGDMRLRETGVVVTAVRRGGIRGQQPQPEMLLQAGDILVLYGAPEDLERAERTLYSGAMA